MIERMLEYVLFSSRWLLAPMFIGLVVTLAALMIRAVEKVYQTMIDILTVTNEDLILSILSLIDLTLVGALIVIVIFAGYENFVSRIDARSHRDWPEWMGKIDFTGLKLKVLSSIVAISAIHLLRSFMDVRQIDDRTILWEVVIHMVFVVSGLILAVTDWLGDSHKGTTRPRDGDDPPK